MEIIKKKKKKKAQVHEIIRSVNQVAINPQKDASLLPPDIKFSWQSV